MDDQPTPSTKNPWKPAFLILLVILIIGANIAAWWIFVKNNNQGNTINQPEASSTIVVKTTPSPAVPTVFSESPSIPPMSPAPSISPSPTVDETSLIKQAVYKLTNLNETNAEIAINQNTGVFAKGTIKELAEVGGAYWLAAKTAGAWVGVYAGQSNPTCAQIAPYNFPVSMVPECLNAGGVVVSR